MVSIKLGNDPSGLLLKEHPILDVGALPALTYDVCTGEVKYRTITDGGGSYNFTNGLTILADGSIGLGGNLAEDTSIFLNDHNLSLNNIKINLGTQFNSDADLVIQQSDGKLVVIGSFTTYDGSTHNRIVRLKVDGTIDNDFNVGSGFDSDINSGSIIQQTDYKLVIGGSFTTYDGSTYNYIIRLNTDGTIDDSFNVGSGFDNSVVALIQQSDGKLVVGGSFTTYDGSTYNKIIRLNTDGTIDNGFNIGSGFNGNIYSIIQQSDNKLILAGYFSTYDGSTYNCIIRLNTDGTIDNSFNVGSGFNDTVVTVIQQSDNKLVVAGGFITYDGSTYNYIIRLNTDGTIDNSFSIGSGFNAGVTKIIKQTDDKLVVVGNFDTYDGSTYNRIIRLNTDGTIDNGFNIGSGFSNSIMSITKQTDDKLVVVGYFTTYDGSTYNRIIRLNTDGTIDDSFDIIDDTRILFFNPQTNNFELGGDYSTTFTDRSLVDKEYVDLKSTTGYNFANGLSILPDGSIGLGGNLNYGVSLVNLSGNTFLISSEDGSIKLNVSDAEIYLTADNKIANYISILNNSLVLNSGDALANSNLSFYDSGQITLAFNKVFLITDSSTTPAGIQYNSDYSATFTDRSLVDRGYVDSHSRSYNFANGLSILPDGSIGLGGTLKTTNTFITAPDLENLFIIGQFSIAPYYGIGISCSSANDMCYTAILGSNMNGSKTSLIEVQNNSIQIYVTDDPNGAQAYFDINGFRYADNYYPLNTTNDRWIPDKAYVDSKIMDVSILDTNPYAVVTVDSSNNFKYSLTQEIPYGYSTQAYAAGSAYTLNSSTALIHFGTTDPSITISAAGTWKLTSGLYAFFNNATFNSNQTMVFKLRRVNNTPADVANAVTPGISTGIIANYTGNAGCIDLPPVYYSTVNNDDMIQLWGNLSVDAFSGGVQIIGAWINAEQIY